MSDLADLLRDYLKAPAPIDLAPTRAVLEAALEAIERKASAARRLTWIIVPVFFAVAVFGIFSMRGSSGSTLAIWGVVVLWMFLAIVMTKLWLATVLQHAALMRELVRAQILLIAK